jgi:predicted DsbA family dithiol-disulfide isomerase
MRQSNLQVFIDVICPWCYVGKRRMERALAMLGSTPRLRVSWHPFELNPDMPKQGIERRIYRMRKFGSWERSLRLDAELTQLGAQEGIGFRYDLITRTPNTFNAHRLIWLARDRDGGQDALVEGVLRAYFTQGRDIGDPIVLAEIARDAGIDASEAAGFLEGEQGAMEIAQEEEAARRAGLSGVPAFLLDGAPLAVGAQPPQALAAALRDALNVTATT